VQGPVRAGVSIVAAAIAALGLSSSGASNEPRAAAAAPEGVGAASRDPQQPCHNRALRLMVVPAPEEAPHQPNSPCARVRSAGPQVCEFGIPAAAATATVAVVGDSHAGHWRGALEAVAQTERWHGLSITHTSCPLSKALRDLPEPKRSRCARWKREVFAWFPKHPEVSIVFVAGLSGGTGVVPARGASQFETSMAGYRAAWDALPATVQRIVVISDTPKGLADDRTRSCIERALGRRRSPGPACARRRSDALDPDAAFTAAVRLWSARVQTLDMTDFFCGRRWCNPVISGALVLRDQNHLTGTYSATLGPFLLRAVEALNLT
jgi:hypothetical protein